MIIRRRIYTTGGEPPFDPSDDFSTDRPIWGGDLTDGDQVEIGDKWSLFSYDTSSSFSMRFDFSEIREQFPSTGVSLLSIKFLDSANGTPISNAEIGLWAANSSGSEEVYLYVGTPGEEILVNPSIYQVVKTGYIDVSYNSGTGQLSAQANIDNYGLVSAGPVSVTFPTNVWFYVNNDFGFNFYCHLTEYIKQSGTAVAP